MNLFYLDTRPEKCATLHCDKHVVKMIIEYAQLMSTAHRMIDGIEYEAQSKLGRRVRRWKHPNNNMDNVLYNGELCYDTPITNDVLGHLSWEDVENNLDEIQKL